ncbi:MAG: CPBP family intramembrane glutamic endopeptidase [Cyanobacteria bacterium P01_A01_bin.84]
MSQEIYLQSSLTPMGLKTSLGLFGAASLALIFATKILIPFLSEVTGREPILFWFLVAGLGIFTPLILLAIYVLDKEGNLKAGVWRERLRFRAMSKDDWFWSLGGFIAIALGSIGISFFLKFLGYNLNLHPPFMEFQPLSSGRYWILAIWLPFWVLNIIGEEILWRGVILPCQEVKFSDRAWLVNALGWALFHIAFGWQLWLMLLPVLLILPYVTQRSQNLSVGVLIHGCINGFGFLAVAFGMI